MEPSDILDNRNLIDFWSRSYSLPEQEMEQARLAGPGDWKELAPSEKLALAACALGDRRKVLDYGCGSAWAGILAAKSGCRDVTAVDAAEGSARAARFYAELFGVSDRLQVLQVPPDWLQTVPADKYDGFICSNVLDVIPPETAEGILREAARVVTRDAAVIIGLNYWLSAEAAEARGLALRDGRLYVDGVLRLVSRSDEAWEAAFAPFFAVEKLEHFAWPGEAKETRRLFYLRKRSGV